MKKLLSALSVSVVAVSVSSASFAHVPPLPHTKHFTVAGSAISGGGAGYINGTECTVTISGTVGPDVNPSEPGHTATGHADYATVTLVNSGAAVCLGKTLDVTLYADGHFDITGQTGLAPCGASLPISGTAVLRDVGGVIEADISPMAFGGCSLEGYLDASPAGIAIHP